MATQETVQQDQEDFAAAFAGDDPQTTEMSEDETFGLTEEPAEEQVEEPAADAEAGTEPEGDMGAPAVVVAIEPVAEEEGPTDPKEIQRQKSWEGRLKAREAELKAREDALKHTESPAEMAVEPGEPAAQEAAEPGVTEAVEEAVAAVASGDLTVDQAMKTLANDFGDDFTKMLGVLIESKAAEIAGKTADERMGKVSGQVDGLINEIVSDKAKSHYESISDVHPDFMDIAASPEFKGYIDGMDETQQAKAAQVIQSGSARQIVKLLSDYKGSMKKVDPPAEDPAMDAAEGVRSKGLKIPEKPTQSNDYADAWDSF